MSYVTPKKSLGQHFLRDKNIAEKIVQNLNPKETENIIEVGPGTGILTGILIDKKLNPYLIEIDRESVVYLKAKFPSTDKKIFHADFLDFPLSDKFSQPVSIVGNFPYNISSQIFFKILENRNIVREVVCMVQKEVGLRIAETPGNKVYGITSVLLQAFYDIQYLFTVSEKAFTPRPNVKSAVIRLKRNKTEKLECNEKLFFNVVKTAFNQRRKTLRNSLQNLLKNKNLPEEILKKRPEELSVQDFVNLTRLLEGQ